jgi:hypothetical protein
MDENNKNSGNAHTENTNEDDIKEMTIDNVLSTEERSLSDGNTITFIKRTTQEELLVPLRDPKKGTVTNIARVILQPWATDIRKAPKHVQEDFIRGAFDSFMRFMTEFEKDPVRKADFEAEVAELRKREKKRKK